MAIGGRFMQSLSGAGVTRDENSLEVAAGADQLSNSTSTQNEQTDAAPQTA